MTFVIPPTVDSDDSDMEEDEAIARANYNSQQNSNSQNSSPDTSKSVSEVNSVQPPLAKDSTVDNAVPASSTKVQSVVKQTTTVQSGRKISNGTLRTRSDSDESRGLVQDSPVTLPKSSGSGAIAQHVKKILEKKNTEKMLAMSKGSSVSSNGQVSSTTKPPPPKASESWISISSTVSSSSEAQNEVFNSDFESSMDTTSPTSSVPPKKVSKIRWSGIDLDSKEGEEEDESVKPRSMRARTHTLAAVHSKGRKPLERGRRMLKELKNEEKKVYPAMKRQSSLTNLNRRLEDNDLELISPELAAWIRGKFIRDLEKKYGGHDVANKAAVSIQRAYREYKLRSRFKQIQRDKHLRTRAQSMRTPGRRPSILRKNVPVKFRKEKSNPDTRDPVLKAREAAKMLNRERVSHTHSGTRLDLVQQKRQGKVMEFVQQSSLDESLEVSVVYSLP